VSNSGCGIMRHLMICMSSVIVRILESTMDWIYLAVIGYKTKQTPWLSVRTRIIPTERLPLVDEI
jgi:hypothetical protein